MATSSPTNLELEVSNEAFIKALKTATYGVKKKTTGFFEISYVLRDLVLSGPLAEATVPADGAWQGHVRISPQIMKNLVKVVPTDDPLKIGFRDGRLYIGKFSIIATLV